MSENSAQKPEELNTETPALSPEESENPAEALAELNIKDQREYDDFAKLDLRIAKIIEAEELPKSKKLLKLQLELGKTKRQILAGLKGQYSPEELIGKSIVIIANLKPAKLMGEESQGMLLAGDTTDNEGNAKIIVLTADQPLPSGTAIC